QRPMKYSKILATPAAVALLALGSSRAHATTFTVTNLADSGGGPLRQAVTDANVAPSADIIAFKAGLARTIILGSQPPITGNLQIQGPGSGLLTVSGSGASRVFAIARNIVTISGLTIANGRIDSSKPGGGGVFNEGDLTLADCILSDNIAEASGGAIFNEKGAVTLIRSSLGGNSAGISGGGIFNDFGTLALTDCALAGNAANAPEF